MTNYTENSGSVRVDYFRPSGKWYMTEAVDMTTMYGFSDIYEAVTAAMQVHWTKTRSAERNMNWQQFTIVVAEPYHKNAYPIMIVAKEKNE